MKLADIAEKVQCTVIGDPELEITGVAGIKEAVAGQLTFLNNNKYIRYLTQTSASALILENSEQVPAGKSALLSPQPYLTFAKVIELFAPASLPPREIDPRAVIAPSAKLGSNVSIGPFVVIHEGAEIGDEVTIHAHCVIYPAAKIGRGAFLHSHCAVREACELGEAVILQNHVTIGSDGFGYAPQTDQSWYKIRQAGRVIIEANVEIGAGSTIDRATIGDTIIRQGAKIDNLVQVGHGSTVGRNTLLCAQVGLAGSSHIGNNVILAGQVGVAGHLEIADGVIATAQTGIPNSIETKQVVSGYPAIETQLWRKAVASFTKLPNLLKELRQLRQRVEQLEQQLAASPRQTLSPTNPAE